MSHPARQLPAASDAASRNESVARVLDEVAALLDAQGANPFRAQAYRRAATVVRELDVPVETLLRDGGLEALTTLPGIGPRLARAIDELAATGRLRQLEWLRGHADPEALLATMPGIGPTLAHRVHEKLGVHTLEELEAAAHDGRLSRLEGFGKRRVRAVRELLAGRLGRVRARSATAEPLPIAEILDVDCEYRARDAAGTLQRIAPRRFNPRHLAWLPVLHTERGPRHYTALFSNTARAHALRKTRDWVVVYAEDDGDDRQATVVTEHHGPLAGLRVVRGRERESAAYYGVVRPGGRATPEPFPVQTVLPF